MCPCCQGHFIYAILFTVAMIDVPAVPPKYIGLSIDIAEAGVVIVDVFIFPKSIYFSSLLYYHITLTCHVPDTE